MPLSLISPLSEAIREALETRVDALEAWATFWTALVVLGLMYEYGYELVAPNKHWAKGKPWHSLVRMGAILVIVGVAGELYIAVAMSPIQGRLRSLTNKTIATLNTESEQAKADAESARALAKGYDAQIASANAASRNAVAIVKNADVRIAEANRAASEAIRAAEVEKLARIKIQQQLAPRLVSESDRKSIADKLKSGSFDKLMARRKVQISAYAADADGILFGLEIVEILYMAGIEYDSSIGRVVPVGLVDMGLKVTGPAQDEAFIRLLITELSKLLPSEKMEGRWDFGKYPEVNIVVGVKTIPGFPTIIQPK